MEAVVAIVKNLLKNTKIVFVLGVVLGLGMGLILGWGIWPVQWTDGNPEVLRADLQKDYLRMTIDSYNRTGDVDTAMARWEEMGTAANNTFIALQSDPGYLNPTEIQAFGVLIQSVKGPIQATDTGSQGSASGGLRQIVLYAAIGVVVLLIGVGALYLFRLFRKSSTVTPMMQAAEHSRNVEKTDFQSLGLAAPITQTMTTYVLGDDLYDESFSIDTQGGDFLGEYGVGVSETVGVGEPKKVAALEIWLFDKNDIKTATKVLMSEHAYNDPNIRARLEPKGELVVVKPQEQVLLETQTLQLLATVVDMDYGMGAMPQKSYFDRITLELAIWPRGK